MDMDADVLESSSWRPVVAKYRSKRKATRTPDFCKSDYKWLHLGLIPDPFMGDMLNASIYVLMLNPGLGPGDYFEYKVRCTVPSSPGGSALRGVGLSSMRFHSIDGAPGDDEDGQEAWFTGRIASLTG